MRWLRDLCFRSISTITTPDVTASQSKPAEKAAWPLWSWMKQHKLKSVLLFLLLIVIVELATIPWFSIASLKSGNPGPTALMKQRMEEARDAGKTLKVTQRWIALSRLPRHVIDAVIVAEDGTFYSHSGIDWFEVQESIEKNVRERRAARGASTITQQLAKNLYLSTSKDPVRKAKELIITLLLENNLGKNRILEIYLNVIEWGRGIFGIEAASQAYFGKSASTLTLDEALRLAAVIPSPLRHRPDADTRYVTRRKEIVFRRLTARYANEYSPQKENSSSQSLNDVTDDATMDSTDIDEGDNGL
ncbi:monofunctional biosynthetic peptidoglycan transglycosylase [bacterium]|nr:MAG: monofunctional biosynthetic peptidoglycan transglycosylase [bacterium]